MFQRWPNENILIVFGGVALAVYIIDRIMPGITGLYSFFTSECLFSLVGICAVVLGCAGLYSTWRRGY
ncbi:hypothetical protein [Dictyobacter aurantiacus]|uniref:Uncharacterized protein n=1 Tax=Dictyobacter aurantiacus TaxID=1936993 RepID=A0A401ZK83_9CHLR|nr:hypothetical protein [Dictyobacter aurantiacus]GCE07263.1 hypothetical protein KDAU_45920 [Dictyobacter aurantiacus]